MLKKLFLIILLSILSFHLKAQNIPNLGIGLELGLPSGNFTNVTGIGLGASIKADIPVSSQFAVTVNGGLMNFFGKKAPLFHIPDLTYLPAKAGLKYILSERFYAEGQLGAALPLNSTNKTLFLWSLGIGNQFRLSGNHNLDFGIRYEAWIGKNDNRILINTTHTRGFIGIRFAYNFNL